MIRINLAVGPGKRKKGKGFAAGARGKPKGSGGGPAGPVFATLFLLSAAGGGAYYYITYMQPPAARGAAQSAAPALPPPVPKADTSPKPSSLVRSTMVESTVKELGNSNEAPVQSRLDTPYPQMSTPEKIHYEALFARNVFDLFTRCTPPAIRLKSLDVDNFQTIYATGTGPLAMVQEMFAAFKEERGELVPKPHSHIKDDGESPGNYSFALMYKPSFGLQVSDPFQAAEQATFKEGLAQHLKNFSRIAGAGNFKMSAAPSQTAVEKAGSYRRVTYKAVGMSTYNDFHKFVLALYAERVPCAMKKVTMTPVKDEQVRVTAEILFTVKE